MGVDIVRTMSLTFGQRKFLIVVVDYFSKWVEVELLASITKRAVI